MVHGMHGGRMAGPENSIWMWRRNVALGSGMDGGCIGGRWGLDGGWMVGEWEVSGGASGFAPARCSARAERPSGTSFICVVIGLQIRATVGLAA